MLRIGDNLRNNCRSRIHLSFWPGVGYVVSYILGSGFLTLPFIFQVSGIIVGVLAVVFVAVLSIVSSFFILETLERATVILSLNDRYIRDSNKEGLTLRRSSQPRANYYQQDNSSTNIDISDHNSSADSGLISETAFYGEFINTSQSEDIGTELSPYCIPQGDATPIRPSQIAGSSIRSVTSNNPKFEENLSLENPLNNGQMEKETLNRRLEITDLCEIFFGPRGRQIYCWLIIIFLYIMIWTYSIVFASSLSVSFPVTQDKWSYVFYIFVLVTIAIPLTLLDNTSQVCLHIVISVFRILGILLMSATALSSYFSSSNSNSHYAFGQIIARDGSEGVLPPSDPASESLNRFNTAYIPLLLSMVAYGFIFHYSIPTLADYITDKYSIRKVFLIAVLLILLLYILFAASVSICFGNETIASSNVLWQNFQGFSITKEPYHGINADNNDRSNGAVPWYALIIAYFSVEFPAIGVLSTIPRTTHLLEVNLFYAYYGEDAVQYHNSTIKTRMFKLMAALPPLIGALFVSDLSKMTIYAGLVGFSVAFIFPACLAHFSAMQLQHLGISHFTIHSSHFTASSFPFIVAGCGVLMSLAVIFHEAFL